MSSANSRHVDTRSAWSAGKSRRNINAQRPAELCYHAEIRVNRNAGSVPEPEWTVEKRLSSPFTARAKSHAGENTQTALTAALLTVMTGSLALLAFNHAKYDARIVDAQRRAPNHALLARSDVLGHATTASAAKCLVLFRAT